MGIRSLCAAAAAVVGIGSAADAATTVNFKLRYEGTVLKNVMIWETVTGDDLWYGDLGLEGAPWELPTLYAGAKKGDIYYAIAEFEEADDEYGGYIAPVCDVGGFNCSVYNWWERLVSLDPFTVVADPFGVWQNGNSLVVTSWGEYYGYGFVLSGDGYEGHAHAITTTFTIIELAPVPLPASAALLPLGIGALALMRRRRRFA